MTDLGTPDPGVPDGESTLAGDAQQHRFVITVTSFGRGRGTPADVEMTRRTLESFLRHAGFTARVEFTPGNGRPAAGT
jgi:hypothetical protein